MADSLASLPIHDRKGVTLAIAFASLTDPRPQGSDPWPIALRVITDPRLQGSDPWPIAFASLPIHDRKGVTLADSLRVITDPRPQGSGPWPIAFASLPIHDRKGVTLRRPDTAISPVIR